MLTEKKSYTLFIGFSSSNFVLAGNIAACAVLLVLQNYAAVMAVCTLVNAAVFICIDKMIKEICRTVLSREISIWMCLIPVMCYTTFYLMLYFPVCFEQRPESMFAAASLLAAVVVMYIMILQYMNTQSREQNLLYVSVGTFL